MEKENMEIQTKYSQYISLYSNLFQSVFFFEQQQQQSERK